MSDFKEWLLATGHQFLKWSDDERNQTLDHLISIGSSSQLVYLAQLLPTLIYRDFFKLLPREISTIIATYLDAKSILNCLLVSRHWYQLLDSLPEVWRHCCWQHYIKVDSAPRSASYYKTLFLKVTSKQLEPLKQCNMYSEEFFRGHSNRIMALHYHDGRLASGSDDHSVTIWQYPGGEKLILPQHKSVSTVKLMDKFVYMSFFDGIIHSWEICLGPQSQFIGHVSAVYSIDVCERLSIMVTGSVDLTIKIWDLQSSQLLTTLMGQHQYWIIDTKIISSEELSSYTLISSDNRFCYIRRMNSEHEQSHIETVSCPNYSIIPHLLVENQSLLKICFQSDDGEDTLIRVYQFQSELNMVQQYKITQTAKPIQLLLGVGQKLAMVISRGDQYQTLSIFGLHTNEVILTKPLPAIRLTKTGSSVTCGSSKWLNGFDSSPPCGLLLAAALENNSIYILSWKEDSSKHSSNRKLRDIEFFS
ncbi:F-box/WD repeat-containing protein 2 isoform X2 [Octopus bimaculoides]|nr:F-box/WD repeat-containing protein 2 isoform X2 [Octopus bimaculoides]XP_014778669.1 F-box/WD repeat-containing protein 2 isoform X2 [Octopus bimaculoides]XP_014778671.1 F-box/WD repeat-containing protein 2 isoform X2 [Octopus bimaculoides]XP_052822014.1 F-box/WD repeat-containing protein 2 isoform X2 [Octopus bimaculoides]XP_052822015.1 F-box/WD repeat-containing protein 2 isoform X2 [Octopus bimaculoides]|eukprot:XP_014778668.1 PREDICTED: F-box/WD repeat-containing protein 2-like isoform X2 [Octopus bimaculoides]